MRQLLLLAAGALLAATNPAQAQMYKCVSPAGKTYYQDGPCQLGAKQKDLAPAPRNAPAPAGAASAKDGKTAKGAAKGKPDPLPLPRERVAPWSEEEREDFAQGCSKGMAHERMREYTRKTGTRLPPETQAQWAKELEQPCLCMQKKAMARWYHEYYASNRGRLNAELMNGSPECFR